LSTADGEAVVEVWKWFLKGKLWQLGKESITILVLEKR
jgi:hypothetical protein